MRNINDHSVMNAGMYFPWCLVNMSNPLSEYRSHAKLLYNFSVEECVYKMNGMPYTVLPYKYCKIRPVCTQDSIYNCISDPIMDGFPIGTADEELVLRAERRQMVAQYEVRA